MIKMKRCETKKCRESTASSMCVYFWTADDDDDAAAAAIEMSWQNQHRLWTNVFDEIKRKCNEKDAMTSRKNGKIEGLK